LPHYVFIYPQIKRLTGAQRLILSLAGAVAEQPGARVTLLTHKFAAECRPALPPKVGLVESGRNLNLTGNHYADSLVEYLSVPALLRHLPPDTDAVTFFGPPSLPGLWWAKHIRRIKKPLLYFCFEPPRAAYTDRAEISRRMGKIGRLVQPLFWLYRPVDRYLTRQAARVLVNGEYGQQLIRETYGLPATIITHGVDLAIPPDLADAARQVREKYALNERSVILTVNHLHPRKRVDLLLRALPDILAMHPDAALLIIGKGVEEAALRQLARDLKLSDRQVIFAGFVPETELAAHYAAADVYAHTGREETFGLSVLEAGSSGLPVVAANEGGPREILLDDETGFLIEATPENFAAKINLLLENSDLRREMGQKNAARVEQRYTWKRGGQDFLSVLPLLPQT
jgi:glycosyltransferase involved in cell wall biosynthesis